MAVFAERGYQEASMGEIARAAEITPAVIYDHFGSKAELHVTLLEGQTEELLHFVAEALTAAPRDPTERLRAGVSAFFAFVHDHPFAWRMLFRDPPSDPAVAGAHLRVQRQATEAIAGFLGSSGPHSLFRRSVSPLLTEQYAQLLKTAQNGLASWWYEHQNVPLDALVDRVMEFCWLGLERVADGEGFRESPPPAGRSST